MKQNFKKILSFLLVAVMLASMVVMAIPVGAEEGDVYELAPNEDSYINGTKVRFETTGADTYARIEDGKLVTKMVEGDMIWFPDLAIKDASTILQYDLTALGNDTRLFIVSGIHAREESLKMYGQGYAAYGKWTCVPLKWKEGGATTISSYSPDWYTTMPYGGNPAFDLEETLTATTTFTQGSEQLYPTTSFQEASVTDPYVHTYPENTSIVTAGGSFGVSARGAATFAIDAITATNLEGEDYSEDFETITNFVGVTINLRRTGESVDFEEGIAFIDFKFKVHADVTADTEFVVKKNDTEEYRAALSAMTPDANGEYTYSTHFTSVAYTDVLTLFLEKDEAALPYYTYTIDYGSQYEEFVTNPPKPGTDDMINEAYKEDFDATKGSVVNLQPGKNIINGHTWTYVKNSADGSAVIKDGKLYFKGSNYDMILFDDAQFDNATYMMEYNLTYLDIPADDIWTNWTAWFGGLFHLAYNADDNGNKTAMIASVTPNDVYIMQGVFDSTGAFIADNDYYSHSTFPNPPGAPTQPEAGDNYYWNGRIGSGIPGKVRSAFGLSGMGNGSLGVRGYNAQGAHQADANLPARGAAMNPQVGNIGFVCGESAVNVIVDNLVIKTKGKTITVDGEDMLVPADDDIPVEDLAAFGKKLVYATVDGTTYVPGEGFRATRLSNITTTQIELSTRKVAADGKTGLKWTTEISKADIDKLRADPNVADVKAGTLILPTADAKGGITTTTANVQKVDGTLTESGNVYTFEGKLAIDKDARDTSYSAIGYLEVVFTNGKTSIVYCDYIARTHAYALSDLVDDFSDVDAAEGDAATNDATTGGDAAESTEEAAEEKKGCKGSVAGVGIVLAVALTVSFIAVRRPKEDNI